MFLFCSTAVLGTALAIGFAMRWEIQWAWGASTPSVAGTSSRPRPMILCAIALALWCASLFWRMQNPLPMASASHLLLGGLILGATCHWAQMGRNALQRQEMKEIAWIIQQRGNVQDQIMRACEREAMERRLRRCQATLMLTRRGGRDLTLLFDALESQVAAMQDDPMEAAAVIGGFAAHLRHVFMESDVDDLPLGEACAHVQRWGTVLHKLSGHDVRISGAPTEGSPLFERRIPALLMLGAVERLGVATLQDGTVHPVHWRWHFDAHTARLQTDSTAELAMPDQELRDWDAAFMLRHGGIAHAGGAWSFELPLLPD